MYNFCFADFSSKKAVPVLNVDEDADIVSINQSKRVWNNSVIHLKLRLFRFL